MCLAPFIKGDKVIQIKDYVVHEEKDGIKLIEICAPPGNVCSTYVCMEGDEMLSMQFEYCFAEEDFKLFTKEK